MCWVQITDTARILRGCGVGLVATAPIRPLAWELPCAVGAALEKTKKKKKKGKRKIMAQLNVQLPNQFREKLKQDGPHQKKEYSYNSGNSRAFGSSCEEPEKQTKYQNKRFYQFSCYLGNPEDYGRLVPGAMDESKSVFLIIKSQCPKEGSGKRTSKS